MWPHDLPCDRVGVYVAFLPGMPDSPLPSSSRTESCGWATHLPTPTSTSSCLSLGNGFIPLLEDLVQQVLCLGAPQCSSHLGFWALL